MATGVLFLLLGCSAAAWRIMRREAYEEGRRRPTKPRKIDVFTPG